MNDVCDYDEPLRIKDICITVITVIMIISGSDKDVKFFENNPKRFVVAGANGTVALFDLEAV